MARMLFGTDGIRGVAGDPPLDHSTVFAVGVALGRYLAKGHSNPKVVIGQDTRESSGWISDSITAGLESAGVQVRSAGVITTPAVAFLARQAFDAGIVISASHNPWTDNGIKVFGHDGYKLSDDVEEQIETVIFDLLHGRVAGFDPKSIPEQKTTEAAVAATDPELLKDYVNWLASQIAGTKLSHLTVLVDCANGASTPVAHEVFRACGLKADFMHDRPTGRNINENCGALHPEIVASQIRSHVGKYDMGITFDGDADRALFSDRNGHVVNGDAVLLLAARDMKSRGKLKADTVVATTMSNMGLELALRQSGVKMLRAPVGDKYVLEEMNKSGSTLGGEQSGHIIFRDGDATTGDGILTALRVIEAMTHAGKALHELVADLKVFPQTIKNVRVKEKKPLDTISEVVTAMKQGESELDGNGRIVVRYSGTEALARVMVEAESEEKMKRITESISGAIQKAIGV
ncbi:MAG TPA: phosphoglucosamine mutase [Terriglobales bacterium]|nr:phosphoglucosamine mutase [Terriglobales bacterium]